MKAADEIEEVIDRIPGGSNRYPAMTYEEGVEEALRWALGEMEEEETGWPFVADD
jgi:hypothetical protein